MVRFEPHAPCLAECAVYVLVRKDISDLKVYPMRRGEVFRAKVTDNREEYQSISGFRAPCEQIVEIVNDFLVSVGENSRVFVIGEFADPLGFHPIP
jgi:hypothetical protein